jgi:hypothetical protein
MAISRKAFLHGAGWATAGAAAGALGWREFSGERSQAASPELEAPWVAESFAQCGEDLIINFMLDYLSLARNISYLDVGAFHPIRLSNTYLFYRNGHRGVLVEPNVAMTKQLREIRPKDVTLEAGIGITSQREADFYVMTDPGLNTFSAEEAEQMVRTSNGQVRVREVRKMPLLDINEVMEEHFRGSPTFLSVDTESLDLPILKSIDFERFRPTVICAETLVYGSRATVPEIPEFLQGKGYVVRGQTFVNTICVDSNVL